MNDRVGQQLGNYRLARLLGQGGFAEVYQAEHIHLNTPAAVKMLYGKLTTQQVQAFVNEAKTIAALRHPAILRVLDFGFEQGLPFLVMDYAPGGTLRDRHTDGSAVPLSTIITYVKQVASALAYAHGKKLIHRDVKPENMLVDADGNILLSDFGIVAVAHSTASMQTIDNIGTVHYMAPEHIQGKPRPASDQYALATVVYEWLCGERPFEGDTSIEVAMRQLSEEPPLLRQKAPSLSIEVEQVIGKALAKDPQQRFPDILAFADALEQASQGQSPTIPGTTTSFASMMGQILGKVGQPGKSAATRNLFSSTTQAHPFSPSALPPTQPAQPFMNSVPSSRGNANTALPNASVYEDFRERIHAANNLDSYMRMFGVIIVCVQENWAGKVIHLIEEERWIRKSIDYPNVSYAKKYPMDGCIVTCAVFKKLQPDDYIVWINPRHAIWVTVRSGETSLVKL